MSPVSVHHHFLWGISILSFPCGWVPLAAYPQPPKLMQCQHNHYQLCSVTARILPPPPTIIINFHGTVHCFDCSAFKSAPGLSTTRQGQYSCTPNFLCEQTHGCILTTVSVSEGSDLNTSRYGYAPLICISHSEPSLTWPPNLDITLSYTPRTTESTQASCPLRFLLPQVLPTLHFDIISQFMDHLTFRIFLCPR